MGTFPIVSVLSAAELPSRPLSSTSPWSFRPVQRPSLPSIKGPAWARTPIDVFVLIALERAGLDPSPPAKRRDWLRRLCFDLTGLPPSESEIVAFLEDQAPDAEERWIDRLLARQTYGERMAQHWLDVVRFAESEGFEYDRHLPGAWRYRDYVVESFNRDKSYRDFLHEQIAGDELQPPTEEGRTAAIFHRLGPVRRNAGNPEIALSRNEVLTERTDIVGAAFLGLTVGCARCHDHKLDPISQKDYYRLQAYMAASQEDDVVLAPAEEKLKWEKESSPLQAQLKSLRQRAEEAEGEERIKLRKEIEAVERRLPLLPASMPSIKNDPASRTSIHVLVRGEWERKGEAVSPGPLAALANSQPAWTGEDDRRPRTALARWLLEPGHPLTARVVVNRLWQWHFGKGLVGTPNDFGSHGASPSHPELLDWLADELVRHDWRLKPLQRMILLSASYRQESGVKPTARALALDPENRLLWRFERRRLSAEEIRDSMLAVSGVLHPSVGGPSVMAPVDSDLVALLYKPSQWEPDVKPERLFRRSVYLMAKRNLRLPFMEAFDQPSLLTSCGRRESSTHAPQALELLNGSLSNELARRFSKRLDQESGGHPRRWVERGFFLACGRLPDEEELRMGERFLAEQPGSELALALFNLNEFLYVP